jgi:hypothetical protein
MKRFECRETIGRVNSPRGSRRRSPSLPQRSAKFRGNPRSSHALEDSKFNQGEAQPDRSAGRAWRRMDKKRNLP